MWKFTTFITVRKKLRCDNVWCRWGKLILSPCKPLPAPRHRNEHPDGNLALFPRPVLHLLSDPLSFKSIALPSLVALGVELSYLFDFFLVSWGKPVLLRTFPLALLLQCPIGFGLLCFHFHSFLCIFWFLFWFLLWLVGYSEVCYLASICLNF